MRPRPGFRPRVIVFARAPAAGRVKTRLGREIGMAAAAQWQRRALAATLRRLQDPRWELVLAVTPDAALGSRALPPGVRRVAQGGGDLGARMARALRAAAPGPALVVGCDLPGLTQGEVAAAFRALGRAEAVFGPAEDGGFWLVGLARGRRRAPAGLFRGARWSTRHALADAEASLGDVRSARIASLRDVDGLADLDAARPPDRPLAGVRPRTLRFPGRPGGSRRRARTRLGG